MSSDNYKNQQPNEADLFFILFWIMVQNVMLIISSIFIIHCCAILSSAGHQRMDGEVSADRQIDSIRRYSCRVLFLHRYFGFGGKICKIIRDNWLQGMSTISESTIEDREQTLLLRLFNWKHKICFFHPYIAGEYRQTPNNEASLTDLPSINSFRSERG